MTSGTGGRLLRMGAIGFASGHPGSYHTALARHSAVELAGVAEVKGRATPASSEAADRLARAAGLHWHDDYRTMLDRTELDIVSVCVAPSASAAVLKTAADRGLHIISEKPLARTLEEAESIVAAVNKAGVAFSLNVPACCFSDPMRSALERVRHGDLGEPRVIFSQFLQPKGPRYAGREVDGKMVAPEYGELQNFGPYAFLAAAKAARSPVRSIFARRDVFFYDWYRPAGLEDLCVASVTFANGCVANIVVGRIPVVSLPTTDLRFEVICSRGSVVVDDGMGHRLDVWGSFGDGSDRFEPGGLRRDYYSVDAIAAYIDDVVSAVIHGHPPEITADDALDAMRFVSGCVDSSREGRPMVFR